MNYSKGGQVAPEATDSSSSLIPEISYWPLLKKENQAQEDALREALAPLSRIFFHRHHELPNHFSVLSDNGNTILQLFYTGKLQYTLQSSDGLFNILKFEGQESRCCCRLKGELRIRYYGDEEVNLGFCTLSSPPLSPRNTLQLLDHRHAPIYTLVDKSQFAALFPCSRASSAPFYDVQPVDTLPIVGRIEERRLLLPDKQISNVGDVGKMKNVENERKKKKISYGGRTSVATIRGVRPLSFTSQNDASSGGYFPSKIGEVGVLSPLLPPNLAEEKRRKEEREAEEEIDHPHHNHFCISFLPSLDHRHKALFIGAFIHSNDDLIRKTRCPRGCCCCIIA